LLLWFTYRWSLFPGNVVGGLLLSTFHVHSAVAWRIGYLPLAVFLNAGFWLLCVVSFRLVREHLSGSKPHRYAIASLITIFIFILTNIVHSYLRPAMCADCFFPHGVPFHLYHEGGFAGGEAIIWGGLAANALVISAVASLLGGTWQWCSRQRMK
jgi:hypothetical protein